MLLTARVLCGIVAVLHLGFFYLEAIAWRKYARSVFGTPTEHIELLAPVMSNQGFYNAIVAAGLLVGTLWYQPGLAWAFRMFFLTAVVLAGAWGAATVNTRIFWVQSAPALVALAVTYVAGRGVAPV